MSGSCVYHYRHVYFYRDLHIEIVFLHFYRVSKNSGESATRLTFFILNSKVWDFWLRHSCSGFAQIHPLTSFVLHTSCINKGTLPIYWS